MYGVYAGIYEVKNPSCDSKKILLEAMDVEEDALNHFVALCGVNVVVPLEHPCWAKKWYFNQGGEIKTCAWWVEVVKASLDLTERYPNSNKGRIGFLDE